MSVLNLLDRPIAFNRTFVDLGVGITGALMLSQCVYWSTRTKNPEGWFYKSRDEWREETGLTRREQETARKNLRAKGFIEEEKRGVPCRVFFKLNRQALEAAVLELAQKRPTSRAESAQLDCTNAPDSDGGKRPTITESTAETTTESTHKPPRAAQEHALPEWLPAEQWADFVEHRKQLKAKLTDRAITLALKELTKLRDAGHDPAAVLEQSVVNGWKGVFPIKGGNVHPFPGKPRPKHTGLDQATDAGLTRRADGTFSL